MVAQLPRPSAPPSTAPGRSAFCSKIAIATQRQRERAFLLSQVDKSREPSINKSHDISRVAPATPSTIKRAHCLLQRSLMKQVNVPLCAGTLSPILDLPESITKLPHTVVALPSTDKDVALPPTVEHLSRGEQHKVGGGGWAAPSTPPSTAAKAAQGQTLDDNYDPYYCCTAHRLC